MNQYEKFEGLVEAEPEPGVAEREPHYNNEIGDVFTVPEFIQLCTNGSINDDDGSGDFLAGHGKGEKLLGSVSCVSLASSAPDIPEGATHVRWYNK